MACGGTVLAAALAIAGSGQLPGRQVGVLAVGAALVTAGLVAALAHRRLGGFTGDVLGAAGILAETVGLLVLAATW